LKSTTRPDPATNGQPPAPSESPEIEVTKPSELLKDAIPFRRLSLKTRKKEASKPIYLMRYE